MCAAHAMSVIHRRSLKVFWLRNNAVADVAFSSLFASKPFVTDADLTNEQALNRFAGRPFSPVKVGGWVGGWVRE